MNNKCAIIIISFNQLKYTKGCVDSIVKNTNYPYRILIIDNGSDKETIEYLQSLEKQNIADVIFSQENLGWVKAVNKGIAACNLPYVCVMNNDVLAYPNWLSQMVEVAQKNENVGIVNPLWELPKRFKGTIDDYYNKVITRQAGQYIETDWARGFCFLIKRQVIDKIGGLDEVYSPGYYDDWDYSIRAINAGFTCVQAKGAFVYHYKNITINEIFGKSTLDSLIHKKGIIFYKKWGWPLRILFIVDEIISQGPFNQLKFIHKLLDEQHKLSIIHNQKNFSLAHTNCLVQYSSLLKISVLLNLIDNLRHSRTKRYDIILGSGRIVKFLRQIGFINKNYLIKEISREIDIGEIKKIIDELKNKKSNLQQIIK